MQNLRHIPVTPAQTNKTDENAFYSVNVTLQGRLMKADYTEQKCAIDKMSPGSAHFKCAGLPRKGERIISYMEHVGRIEGHVIELTADGFELEINATDRKKSKLAAQLTWLANKHELGLPEDRRHERIADTGNLNSEVRLPDGRTYPCRIIDLSVSGAAFEIDVRPAMNTMVTLGSMEGRVVRHFDNGIAINFGTERDVEDIKHHLS